MTPETIQQMLQRSVERFGDRRALGFKRGNDYAYLTYRELWERVRAFRRGLAGLGVRKGDRIALLSENRAEWAIADLAAQCAGVVTVPIYSTLPASQVAYIVRDSAARVLIVSDRRQLEKALALTGGIRTLEHVVLMDGAAPAGVELFERVMALNDGAAELDAELDAIAAAVSPDDIATLIYTSGTTGDPKGAMLTHRNLLHTSVAAREVVEVDENDVFLSFLPLCHIIERVGGHYLPLSIGAQIVYSAGVFAIAEELSTVQPTVFLCVPRLYESMQEKFGEYLQRMPARQRRVVEWALGVGMNHALARKHSGRSGLVLDLQYAVADRLALSKVRAKLVGGRPRYIVSGGAPLNPATAEFFEALGVQIVEGYGLTECSVISLNPPQDVRHGTVGRPLPGIEVRIAEDGEILSRGPSLMRGYFGRPEDTAEVIGEDGWFHTGDVGQMDADGYLKITDRKKDIIVLANGKNVAPQPIESRLRRSPFIGELVLLGDKQNAIVAIVVPAFEQVQAWLKARGSETADRSALIALPEVRRLIKDEIDHLSEGLADFERVKRFTLIDRPFSIEGGELTPTLKVRRRFIAEAFAEKIEHLVR